MLKPQILIQLELTASRLIKSAIEPPVAELAARAASDKRPAELFAAFDLRPYVEPHLAKFEELAVATAIFGASQLVEPHLTLFTKGEKLRLVRKSARTMARMVGDGATARIRRHGLQATLAKTPIECDAVIRKSLNCCARHTLFKADRPKTIHVEDDEDDISDALNAATMGNARLVGSSAANLTTTRLAAYGFLAQAEKDGVKSYQINSVLDDRVCPVCAYMHGKTFEVDKALKQTEKALEADDPDDLEDIVPWPDQNRDSIEKLLSSDEDQMADDGFQTPPFHPACYAEGTKVYTKRGFVEFPTVNLETDEFLSLNPETRQLEWVKATHYIERDFKGDMLAFKQGWGRDAMLVTPDHPMFYDRRVDKGTYKEFVLKTGTITKFLTGDVNWLYKTSEHKGVHQDTVRVDWGDRPIRPFLKLLAYFLSEGNLYPRDGRPMICQSKHFDQMRADIEACGYLTSKWGDDKIIIHDYRLGAWLKQFGKAHEKHVPSFVKDLTPELINVFLDAYALGDGSRRQNNSYSAISEDELSFYTNSVRMRDDLVELLIRAGHGATYELASPKGTVTQHRNGVYASNYDCWIIRRLTTKRRRGLPRPVPYQGKVYDVSLERNHSLLIEWQGSVTWGSNCRCILAPVGTVNDLIPTMSEKGAERATTGPGWLASLLSIFETKASAEPDFD